MTISVFRWTDGPYRAFNDQNGRRYLVEDDSACIYLDRLGAHMHEEPDENLVIERRFSRNSATDLWVSGIYFQECDNLFEIMTLTAPILLMAPGEICTLFRLASERNRQCPNRMLPEIPRFLQDSALVIMPVLAGFMNASGDSIR